MWMRKRKKEERDECVCVCVIEVESVGNDRYGNQDEGGRNRGYGRKAK